MAPNGPGPPENGGPPNTIAWTRPMLERFKKAYLEAEKQRQEFFRFEGNAFHTLYAMYLIEFLEQTLEEGDEGNAAR